jgi:four helix bundle protein
MTKKGVTHVTKSFENLRVYKLSESLADQIWRIVRGWDNLAKDTVGKQIVRSADSIGANIAEGTGRGTYQDNRRFVRTARGSFYETRHWLRRAYARGLLRDQDTSKLQEMVKCLGPTINAYLNSIGTSKKPANDQ